MTDKTFLSKVEELPNLLSFVEQFLETCDCPIKTMTALCVAIEEVFVNVANYAYKEGEGDVSFRIGFEENSRKVIFQMEDKGIPFNPLERPDPDVTKSAEEREIGGLGIFIAKKTMDEITYAYEDGKNSLTMTKKI